MRRKLKLVFNFFIFSNVFIALGAVCQCLITYRSLGVLPNAAMVALVFTACFITYGFSMVNFGWESIQSNGNPRQDMLASLYFPLKGLIVVGILVITVLFFLFNRETKLVLIASGLVALAYCLPLLPIRGQWVSLRKVPGLKIFLLAGLWTVCCAVLPVLESSSGMIPQKAFWWAAGRQFLFIFAAGLAFDIRDIKDDRKARTLTLPVMVGPVATKWIAGASLAFYSILVWLDRRLLPETAYILTGNAALLCVLIIYASSKKSAYYYMVFTDGLLVLPYLLILLADVVKIL